MKKIILFVSLLVVLTGCDKNEPITEKCNASDYLQVTIGQQTWMAENYRCSKYDTQSEAYKAGITTVPISETAANTPYYVDASDKSKWDQQFKRSAGNLSKAQIAKLGYLYNWAAVMGIANIDQTIYSTGNRQGICPNGWHIPSDTEWNKLQSYIEYTQDKGSKTAGKHLKSASGWARNGSGADTYGFAALPSGCFYSRYNSLYSIGENFNCWTSTRARTSNAYYYGMYCGFDHLLNNAEDMRDGYSVRCIKN